MESSILNQQKKTTNLPKIILLYFFEMRVLLDCIVGWTVAMFLLSALDSKYLLFANLCLFSITSSISSNHGRLRFFLLPNGIHSVTIHTFHTT